MTPSEKLYQTAKERLGEDLSPTQDTLGCAETVSTLLRLAYGDNINTVSTLKLLEYLESNPNYKEVTEPEGGDIIIAATGTQPANSPVKNGHTGIMGKLPSADGSVYIMSNNSNLPKPVLDTQFTLKKWTDYFDLYGHFVSRFFRRISS